MKRQVLIMSVIAIIVVSSCEKLIDVDQPDIVEQDQAFGDNLSTDLSLLGLYSLMADVVEPLFLAGEVRADLVTTNKSANPYLKEYNNNSFSASNPYVSTKPFYSIINNANDFINEFGKQYTSGEMDSTKYVHYISELNAIRVWTQYQILRIYGKVKYYKTVEALNSDSIPEYTYFNKDFIDTLITDLRFSDTVNFTDVDGVSIEWQISRMNDFYINQLMAELYMEKGDFEMAMEKFSEILFFGDDENWVTGRFRVNDGYEFAGGWFSELFLQDWESSDLSTKALFLIAFDNKYNQTNELWNWTQSLDYQVAPADWFVDMFNRNYISDDEEYPVDGRILSINTEFLYGEFHTDYAINKYLENDKPFIIARTAHTALLRMFCMNAEGSGAKLDKELAKLRERIQFTSINFDGVIPENEAKAKLWVEDIIVDEMAYESAFEGQRWFDLMRVAIRRNDPSYLANKVAQKYPEESRERIRKQLMNKENWFIPTFD